MLYFTCGKVRLPLVLVQGASWTRSARTVERTGGYVVSRGYNNIEVSIRAVYNFGVINDLGLDAAEIYRALSMLVTNCKDEPSELIIGDFEPVPSMLFALISCNKTQTYDSSFSPEMEMDFVFAGVRAKKEMARTKALADEEPSGEIPIVSITKGTKTLELKDGYSITECIQRENSVTIGFAVRDDMAVIEREGFLSKLVDGNAVLNFNNLKYYIISSQIDGNFVSIEASFYPISAQKAYVKTYKNTTLKAIIKDIATRAGIDVDCRVDASVDYYLNSMSPMDAMTALVESSGALAFWRGGKLLIADVPSYIQAKVELEAQVEAVDSETEKVSACTWVDGLKSYASGDSSGTSFYIESVYSGEQKSAQCLAKAKFLQNTLQVQAPTNERLQAGSAVSVWVGKTLVDALVYSFECDYLGGTATYFLNYI